MQQTFQRDPFTWITYLGFGIFVYFLNILGPITPFLKDELKLTYTVSSFHFSAFAIGILIVGLAGHLIIQRIGKKRSFWLGLFGMSLSAFALLMGKSPILTISASFIMGLIGSLVLAIVPAAIADHHGQLRAVALAEANVAAALFATAAPLLVGWAARFFGDWRWALGIMTISPIFLYLFLGRDSAFSTASSSTEELSPVKKPLPALFWLYWLALMLSVAVEFCMIFWGADYLEQILGLVKANAAQSISLFTAAMIIARIIGSRLVQHVPQRRMAIISGITAATGFLLFWLTHNTFIGLFGLFVTGLGVANLYPMIISLAINAAEGDTLQAGARVTLASGTAILALPLLLGRLADMLGIHPAYGTVLVLIMAILLIVQFAEARTAG